MTDKQLHPAWLEWMKAELKRMEEHENDGKGIKSDAGQSGR